MYRGSSRTHSHRTRTERVLRFALRRKPCIYMVFLELGLIAVLIASVYLLTYHVISNMHSDLERLHQEDEILNRYKGLQHNKCALSANKTTSLRNCDRGCGATARIIRTHLAEDHNCLQFVQSTTCNDRTECIPAGNVTQCHGVMSVPMPKLWKKHESVFAPRIDLSQHLNKTLQSQEIVVQCPACRALTRFFKTNATDRCHRKLVTIKQGWPMEFAYCDNFEYSDSTDCELITSKIK